MKFLSCYHLNSAVVDIIKNAENELLFDGNNDGCVSSDDLLILLSEYGQCE